MRLPDKKIFGNFYVLVSSIFLIWMLFFDSNDFFSLYALRSKVTELEDQKAYYQKKIEEVKKERQELFSNPDKLEKFAREKYLMKKEHEDLYIVQKPQ